MKTSNKLLSGLFSLVLLIIFLFLVFVRFNLGPRGMGEGDELVKGNNVIKTEKHLIANYNDIRIDENFEVTLKKGPEFLEVTADENLLPYIKPTVANGRLDIDIDKKVSLQPTGMIKITIGINQLERLQCAGHAVVQSADTLKSDHLELAIAGSGQMKFIIETNTTSASVSGSGLVQLQGNCQELNASVSGSGRINAQDLIAETVEARISGSGSGQVHAVDFLNAQIAGSGNLTYKGNPQLRERIGGSGRVSQVQ